MSGRRRLPQAAPGQAAFDFEAGATPTSKDERLAPGWVPDPSRLDEGWRPIVESFLAESFGQGLLERLQASLAHGATIYPPDPLRALALTSRSEVRVVVLGQDPYHGPGQAEGLAFSVRPGVRMPPSLRNVFRERERDLGVPMPPSDQASLAHWARQGVLLLNAVLTVEAAKPASHAGWGWEALTDELVRAVAQNARPCVFMLWGNHAQAKRSLIESADPQGRHRILQANHPSPLSALRPPLPFIGCGHFGQANAFLAAAGRLAIDW